MGIQASASIADVLFDIWTETGKESTFTVAGRSMWPLIESGDKVQISHSRTGIKPGMIVAFRQNDRIVVHRVLRVYPAGKDATLICRGDHNRHLDRRVRASQVVGKIISITRNERKIINVAYSYWRVVGVLIALNFKVLRLLPRKIAGSRLTRVFSLVLLRIGCYV
ncbi:MAG: S24/S26 family peptidase [bacterium]